MSFNNPYTLTNNQFSIINPGLLFLRGPLKGGSPGESTKPSLVKEFVTEADPEIDSQNFTSKDSRSGGWGGCGVG